MAGNPIELLRADHRKVESLFEKFEEADTEEEKSALVEEICTALENHTKIEEEIFYPAVEEANSGTEKLVEHGREEHDEMKGLILEVRGTDTQTQQDELQDSIGELKTKVLKHVEEEERDLLPRAREVLEGELTELGEKMEKLKKELEE